jgi:hypothetical protein
MREAFDLLVPRLVEAEAAEARAGGGGGERRTGGGGGAAGARARQQGPQWAK